MIAIENDLGRFEAETEKEALALARKAKRAAEAKAKIDSANYELASLRAQANGYRIMERFATGPCPNGWRIKSPESSYVKLDRRVNLAGECYHISTYDGEHGRAIGDHYGYRVEGIVWNGSGFDIAVFLRSISTGQLEAYAIGIQGESLALVGLPNITPEMFERD